MSGVPRSQQHRLSNYDLDAGEADCAICGRTKIVHGNKYPPHNRRCRNSPGAVKDREWRDARGNRRAHGLYQSDARELTARIGLCQNPRCPNTVRLVVDHLHGVREPRGVLCHQCNVSLGLLKEDPERLRGLAEYIENPPGLLG